MWEKQVMIQDGTENTTNKLKFCQSCIERGVQPPNLATREWTAGVFYCDECFQPLIENMSLPGGVTQSPKQIVESIEQEKGPILEQIYKLLNIPEHLQFTSVDSTCRNYDKLFNFHAPSVVNYESAEELAKEIEARQIALFQIKYSIEPLQDYIKKLKEKEREANNLKGYNDSREDYAKGEKKKSPVKQSAEAKMAKALGMTLEAYQEFQKKARERNFNVMAGNCPECGGSMPCSQHPNK
jgi:hypothetical protein